MWSIGDIGQRPEKSKKKPLNQNKMITAIQLAIEKINKQIEISQAARIEALKEMDNTSCYQHHGMVVSLVAFRQELKQLLEMEKQQMKMAQMHYSSDVVGFQTLLENQFEGWYNQTFKSE